MLKELEMQNAYIGEYLAPGIYHNSTLGLISLSSDGSSWVTIADKNLGASVVYNDGDTLSYNNCGASYQRGNNYGFNSFNTGSISASANVNASNYGPGNYYSNYIFRGWGSSTYWDTSNNTNLWGGDTGTNEAMRGPCGEGFHIPTNSEFNSLISIGIDVGAWISGGGSSFKEYLKIPFSGYIDKQGVTQSGLDSIGRYWCSNATSNANYSYYLTVDASNLAVTETTRNYAHSIRPFANTPIVPDSSRTKLY